MHAGPKRVRSGAGPDARGVGPDSFAAVAGCALVPSALLPTSLTLPSGAANIAAGWLSAGQKRCHSPVACTSLKDAWPFGLLNGIDRLAPVHSASVVLCPRLLLGRISPADRLSHHAGLPQRCRRVPRSQIQGFEPTTSAWSGTAVTPLARLAPLLGFPLSRASRRPPCTLRFGFRRCVLPRLSPGAGFRRCSLLMLGALGSRRTCVQLCRCGLASQGFNRWAS